MVHTFGYVGLGAMGAPMVANLVKAGHSVHVYDVVSAENCVEGTKVCRTLEELARHVSLVFVCVPDGLAVHDVAAKIIAVEDRKVNAIVNLSTTGVEAAEEINAVLMSAGLTFVDAPVSGGRAGAVKGSITIMWSGDEALLADVKSVLETFSGNQFFVGSKPGQGQALKLLNNFLSATAMTATSEAILFGLSHDLDMMTMLDVVNVSTGQNSASRDKFPKCIATETFDTGFRMALMEKDIALYLGEVERAGTPHRLGALIADYFAKGVGQYPEGDFTEIYKVVDRERR